MGGSDPESRVVGVYPATDGELVWMGWARNPQATVANLVAVEAWAVLEDGRVVPVGSDADGRGSPSRVLTHSPWGRTLNDYGEQWIRRVPALPVAPRGTSMPSVPVRLYDSETVIVGVVGVGREAWGFYRLHIEQVVSGVDLLSPRGPEVLPNEWMGSVLSSTSTRCRLTWGEHMTWIDADVDEDRPTVMLEASTDDD